MQQRIFCEYRDFSRFGEGFLSVIAFFIDALMNDAESDTGCCISSRFVQVCNPGLVEIFDILGTSG